MAIWAQDYLRGGLMASAAIICAATAAPAMAQTRSFNVPAQAAASGLSTFARQADIQLLISARDARGKRTRAVRGTMPVEQALARLLNGTGLRAQATGARTYSVVPVAGAASDETSPPRARGSASGENANRPAASASLASPGEVEIVVTARKQDESSLDVPMGLTAFSGEALVDDQSYRLEDFVGKVPGLNMTQTTGTQLSIRGIVADSQSINAPVATYIDDTPLVGVGAFSGGSVNTPNLDSFDVARIEILKGPQGTLYGASALGGVLKYVTNAPDPSGLAAKFQGGLHGIARSDDGFGHNLHGMINVPLADNVALRVVGYHNDYPGYVDDLSRGRKDLNDMRIYGGRASLLWNVTPDLSIRLNLIDHRRKWDGTSGADLDYNNYAPRCGPGIALCQSRFADQPGHSKLKIYNAVVNWDLGEVKLTSSTTYDTFEFIADIELIAFRPVADIRKGVPGSGLWGLMQRNNYWGDDFVHETRLASDRDGFFNWQAGIYYTDKATFNDQSYLPINRLTNLVEDAGCGDDVEACAAPGVEFSGTTQPATYREFAAFGNVNFQINPEFDISLGARYSDQAQTFEQIGRKPQNPDLPLKTADDKVLTWSADARWRFTNDLMAYARVATGFSPGGPNVAPTDATVIIPLQYKSATTANYELGFKGMLLDKALTVELAAFQIDWQDIQVRQQFGTYNAINNAASARSRGVEWAFHYKPVPGLTLGLTGAYIDARLTKEPPAGVVGYDGEPLAVTPKLQLAGSADYKWPMFGLTGVVGADWRYQSRRFADLTNSAATRQSMPSYHLVDLRAGVEGEHWRFAAYVKNVGNRLALSYLGGDTGGFLNAYHLTPRTVGVDLSVDF